MSCHASNLFNISDEAIREFEEEVVKLIVKGDEEPFYETFGLKVDFKKIICEFFNRAKSNPIGDKDEPHAYRHGEKKYYLYERNDAGSDLLFLLTLFLERGNNVPKILTKCGREVSHLIRRKASAYGIPLTRRGSSAANLTSSTITLARLSQAFPIATACIIIEHQISGKLVTKALAGIHSLPLLMQHTIFPSLIPKDDDEIESDLKDVALVLNAEIRILLSAPKDKMMMERMLVEDLIASSDKYVTAAMGDLFISDEMKKKVLKKANIMDVNGKLEINTVACVAAARKFISMGSIPFSNAVKHCNEDVAKPEELPSTSQRPGASGGSVDLGYRPRWVFYI